MLDYSVDKIRSTIGIDNNPTNKQLYADHIDNLLDYYDYQILNEIANVKTGPDGIYDLPIMSEKAVGFDWLKKKTTTLRHSTGCAKFTGVNDQKKAEMDQKKAEMDQKKAQKKAEMDQKKKIKK